MSTKRTLGRLLCAASVGFAPIAACAGAAPASVGAAQAWTPDPDADPAARRDPEPAPPDAGDPADGGPRCPYGSLEDPHRGFVRCLLPEERDAGWLPPPPQGDAPPPSPLAPSPPATPAPPRPRRRWWRLAPPSSTAARSPRWRNPSAGPPPISPAASPITAASAATRAPSKVQFLVRLRGRAEGVEVLGARGVSSEAAGCVRHLIKNKAIGAPTADPVGVTVVITFKAAR